MDSKNEEISSIFERFRRYLIDNQIDFLLKEFHDYRQNWSENKFRMFLTNVLVVMRTWADNPHQMKILTQQDEDDDEDWDREESPIVQLTIAEKMKQSSQHLFFSIVDYLQTDSTSNEDEFDMWKRILTNKWTMNEQFYIHLSEEKISLPTRLTRSLHNDMYEFYITTSHWSSSTKILLIELGLTYLLIHDNVFLGCNHILNAQNLFTLDDYITLLKYNQKNPLIYQRKLITSMNTPEKMKFFLDYYPNIDLNELIPGHSELYQQRTPLTILDRLLKMEISYYQTIEPFHIDIQPNFQSNQINVRTANMLYLFQKLILNKAKLSISLDGAYYQNHRIPFYVSTIGFYLLSILRFRDVLIIPTTDELDHDEDILPNSLIKTQTQQNISTIYLDTLNQIYMNYLIKRSSTFNTQFRRYFFQHLNFSYPYFHTKEFFDSYQSIQNHRLKNLFDELREQRTFLTLKQICRLKIKQSIQFYPADIQQLKQLPLTLQYYLSFDLLNPNFIQILIEQFQQVNGRIKPTFYDDLQFHEHNYEQINAHQDWEDQIPEDVDYENEDDEDRPDEYEPDDADLFDEEGLYSDNNEFDDDEW